MSFDFTAHLSFCCHRNRHRSFINWSKFNYKRYKSSLISAEGVASGNKYGNHSVVMQPAGHENSTGCILIWKLHNLRITSSFCIIILLWLGGL